MYKKKKQKNGKFYGCEKLYFTKLLYQRKRKARDRKEHLTTAPSQSCFVTVSVFVGISVDVLQVEGYRYYSVSEQRGRAVNTGVDDTLRNLDQSFFSKLQASILPEGTQSWAVQAKTVFLSLLAAKRPFSFSPFQLSDIQQASITGFTELLAWECTIDW